MSETPKGGRKEARAGVRPPSPGTDPQQHQAAEKLPSPHKSDYVLLAIGLAVVLVPLVFVVLFPAGYEKAQFYTRVLASLGGGLVGATIPGILDLHIPGIKATGAIALTVLFFMFNPTGVLDKQLHPPKVEVQTAVISGIGAVSLDLCPSSSACPGLQRGSMLSIKLTRAGYAAAFIEDRGRFYNQEGRLITANVDEGHCKLYPGTDKTVDSVYTLWVVTSDSMLVTSADATALRELPVGTSGQIWGPAYLATGPAVRSGRGPSATP